MLFIRTHCRVQYLKEKILYKEKCDIPQHRTKIANRYLSLSAFFPLLPSLTRQRANIRGLSGY